MIQIPPRRVLLLLGLLHVASALRLDAQEPNARYASIERATMRRAAAEIATRIPATDSAASREIQIVSMWTDEIKGRDTIEIWTTWSSAPSNIPLLFAARDTFVIPLGGFRDPRLTEFVSWFPPESTEDENLLRHARTLALAADPFGVGSMVFVGRPEAEPIEHEIVSAWERASGERVSGPRITHVEDGTHLVRVMVLSHAALTLDRAWYRITYVFRYGADGHLLDWSRDQSTGHLLTLPDRWLARLPDPRWDPKQPWERH